MKMKNKLGKVWYLLVALVGIIILGVLMMGCLSPQQRMAFGELTVANKAVQEMLLKYDAEITKVRGWIASGKIDRAEGQDVVKSLLKERTEWVEKGKQVAAGFTALKEAESPWWLTALGVVTTVLGVGGPIVGGRYGKLMANIAQRATSAVGVMSRGIESHKEDPSKSVAKHIGIEADRVGNGTRTALGKIKGLAAKHEI